MPLYMLCAITRRFRSEANSEPQDGEQVCYAQRMKMADKKEILMYQSIGANIGPTKQRSRLTAKHSILGCLILSIACTFANVFIGHRRFNSFRRQQRYKYEHNHMPPQTNSRKIGTEIKNARNLKGDRNASDPKYITEILRGEKRFPKGYDRLKYRPGDLQMSSTEALQHCYVDATKYQNHIKSGKKTLVSMSKRHKLFYRNIPKSSSSSARYAMENYFHGEDIGIKLDDLIHKVQHRNHTLVSFIREPLNRFYSSYDEAYYRWGPWMGSERSTKSRPMLAKAYHEHKHKVLDKYPYLYDGIHNLKDFHRSFCPEEVLNGGGNANAKCSEAQSVENGTLAHRFEQFVHDYDGEPFDVHLSLQVPNLIDQRSKQPLPISILYNASEAEKGWRDIAESRGVEIPKDGLKVGRKTSRRINLALVSDVTKRKICRLMALDYCCLNIELPEVCSRVKDEGVYCAMEMKDLDEGDSRRKNKNGQRLIIHPWEIP